MDRDRAESPFIFLPYIFCHSSFRFVYAEGANTLPHRARAVMMKFIPGNLDWRRGASRPRTICRR